MPWWRQIPLAAAVALLRLMPVSELIRFQIRRRASAVATFVYARRFPVWSKSFPMRCATKAVKFYSGSHLYCHFFVR